MAHYKIKNITGKLTKRHVSKDIVLNIEYHVGFQKKYCKLGVGNEMLLTCRTLPVSVHGLRAKNLIIVTEISENEFVKLQKPSAKKTEVKPKKIITPKVNTKVEEVKTVDVKPKTTTKKTTKKKSETEQTVVVKEEN